MLGGAIMRNPESFHLLQLVKDPDGTSSWSGPNWFEVEVKTTAEFVLSTKRHDTFSEVNAKVWVTPTLLRRWKLRLQALLLVSWTLQPRQEESSVLLWSIELIFKDRWQLYTKYMEVSDVLLQADWSVWLTEHYS